MGIEPKEKISRFNEQKLSNDIDAVLSGKYKNSHITLMGETPKILQKIGVPNKPILMTAKHAYLVINDKGVYNNPNDNYHNLGKNGFLLAIKLMQSPAMVLQNKKNKDEILLVLNWYDKQKNILIMPMKLNGRGYKNYIEVEANIVKSVYGKEGFKEYINRNFAMDDILYVENKKIRDLQ